MSDYSVEYDPLQQSRSVVDLHYLPNYYYKKPPSNVDVIILASKINDMERQRSMQLIITALLKLK